VVVVVLIIQVQVATAEQVHLDHIAQQVAAMAQTDKTNTRVVLVALDQAVI
jgi:hypothetical protein